MFELSSQPEYSQDERRKALVGGAQPDALVSDAEAEVVERLQPITEACDEEDRDPTPAEAQAALAQKGWEGLTYAELRVLPDSPEKEAERKRRREKLKQDGLKFLQDIGLLKPKEEAAPEAVTEAQMAAADEMTRLGQEMGQYDVQPVIEANVASGSAVATWTCAGCRAEGSNGQKGVAKKWSAARELGDALYCADCRKSGKYG